MPYACLLLLPLGSLLEPSGWSDGMSISSYWINFIAIGQQVRHEILCFISMQGLI